MAGVKVYRWIMVFLSAGVLCACGNNDSLSGLNSDMNDTIISENIDKSEEEAAMQLLKGYDSPVEDCHKKKIQYYITGRSHSHGDQRRVLSPMARSTEDIQL